MTCDDVIKLADLGTAKVMQECSVADSVRGTTIYMSPEMRACLSFITGLVYSYPTDIWYYYCYLVDFLAIKHILNKGLSDVFCMNWYFWIMLIKMSEKIIRPVVLPTSRTILKSS